LEDVGHGGMKMAEVEEVEDTKEVEDMTGVKDMKNDVRKDNESITTMPVT
jgi:Asp-tRNA(Asn)/Glu-tRNA(Gln) amidotransferase C subunit